MQKIKTSAICALLCVTAFACFDSDEYEETSGDEAFRAAGDLWQGCLEDPQNLGALLDDWGCVGHKGDGLACFESEYALTGQSLSICVPQIADPNIPAICWPLPTPPTSGLVVPEKGLCLPSCSPGTCEPGYLCSDDGFCMVPW